MSIFLMTNKFVTRIVNISCNIYICNKNFGHVLQLNFQDFNLEFTTLSLIFIKSYCLPHLLLILINKISEIRTAKFLTGNLPSTTELSNSPWKAKKLSALIFSLVSPFFAILVTNIFVTRISWILVTCLFE